MPKIYSECACCGTDILDGDDYYDINGEIMCENCAYEWLRDQRYTADIEGTKADEWYDRMKDGEL